MDIPTVTDISPTNLLNLDERVAYDHFFGKTLTEARILFSQSDVYADDLIWMGRPAFEYYIAAYVDYLKATDCKNIDIYVPMSVVMGRYDFDDVFVGVMGLIDIISEIRRKCPNLPCDSFTRNYDKVAQEIKQKG